MLVSQSEHHQTITKPRRTKDGNIILQFWVDSVGRINQNGIEVKPINLITSSCKDSVSILDFFDETPNFKIIFVTVYNQYTVKAFELSAVDSLVKPADISRLKNAVEEANIYISRKELIDKYEVLTNGWTVTL